MNSIEKMTAIEVAFRDAYNHVSSHFPDATRKNVILRFISAITMQYSVYLVFTSDGLKSLMNDVFSNNTVRDFVLKLTSAFMVRLGASDNDVSELSKTLACALCAFPAVTNRNDLTPLELLAIPDELKSRLPEYSDVESLLNSNKWLITIVMISLYLRIELQN